MSLSLVAYGESSGSDSEPEGEAVNSRSSKDHVRNILTVLPRPKRSSGGRGPVRIALPTVEGVSAFLLIVWVRVGTHWSVRLSVHPSHSWPQEDSGDEDTPLVKKPKEVKWPLCCQFTI